jgi:predicted small metal-binding protein
MKVIKCADVGYDCPGVIKANTAEEAMAQAAAHAKEAHGLHQVTPQIAAKIKSVMRDE